MMNPNAKALIGSLLFTVIGLMVFGGSIDFFAWGEQSNKVFLYFVFFVLFVPSFSVIRVLSSSRKEEDLEDNVERKK